MIGYIKGWVLDHTDGRLIVTLNAPASAPSFVMDSGTLGYQLTVPQSPEYGVFMPGKPVELFVYTHVREDALDLYGFSSRSEKEIFLTLLGVTGIGPKGAMGILSRVEPARLVDAIMNGDKESLTQIPGIGKKTAERVVLELADPLRKKMESGALSELSRPSGATAGGKPSFAGGAGERTMFRDAKDALLGLGYREQEVSSALEKLLKGATPPARVEELIRSALQQLG